MKTHSESGVCVLGCARQEKQLVKPRPGASSPEHQWRQGKTVRLLGDSSGSSLSTGSCNDGDAPKGNLTGRE